VTPTGFLVHPDRRSAIEALAVCLAGEIQGLVDRRGACRIALAGGSTPADLYRTLAAEPWRDRIPWASLHVFWGDDRCVPPDHPDSNARMARETLLDRVPIPPAQVHPVDGTLPPTEAAAEYAADLGGEPLDVVLLGMGGDGHTASLFPGELSGAAAGPVVATRSPSPPPDRVSLALETLNAAGRVLFLVTGRSKARRIREIARQLLQPVAPETLPAARVRPVSGEARWFLDSDAASELPGAPGSGV